MRLKQKYINVWSTHGNAVLFLVTLSRYAASAFFFYYKFSVGVRRRSYSRVFFFFFHGLLDWPILSMCHSSSSIMLSRNCNRPVSSPKNIFVFILGRTYCVLRSTLVSQKFSIKCCAVSCCAITCCFFFLECNQKSYYGKHFYIVKPGNFLFS